MQLIIKIIVVAMTLGFGFRVDCAPADRGYQYEKREIEDHVLHILRINPKDYKIELAKANNGATGRETVSSIAKRLGAEIAINGGFFEIGNGKDGMPSGTLVINGHKYNIRNKVQPLIIINENKFFIVEANPKNYSLNSVSMVSGIPLLIWDDKVLSELSEKKSDFYLKPHARTAVGTKADGTIVIVVAEHPYSRDMSAISMGEVQSLMNKKGMELAQQYHHENSGEITMSELKEILRKEFDSKEETKGLTIVALAKLMKKLGCQSALNLDGGGSSTLWINGKVVNHIFGDKDEDNGLETMRPVSDAIVFKRK